MTIIVYTIGHSTRGLYEFIELARKYDIRVIVDVRRWPTSRKFPWFSRSILEVALEVNGIHYVWLGRDLGGYRPGGYVNYMSTSEFCKGLKALIGLIECCHGRTALMCRERLWFKCHRRFISHALACLGYKIIHIIDVDRIQEHKLKEEYCTIPCIMGMRRRFRAE